jgi:hypothetical protein
MEPNWCQPGQWDDIKTQFNKLEVNMDLQQTGAKVGLESATNPQI